MAWTRLAAVNLRGGFVFFSTVLVLAMRRICAGLHRCRPAFRNPAVDAKFAPMGSPAERERFSAWGRLLHARLCSSARDLGPFTAFRAPLWVVKGGEGGQEMTAESGALEVRPARDAEPAVNACEP